MLSVGTAIFRTRFGPGSDWTHRDPYRGPVRYTYHGRPFTPGLSAEVDTNQADVHDRRSFTLRSYSISCGVPEAKAEARGG